MFYKEEKLAGRLKKPINDPIGFNVSFSRRKKLFMTGIVLQWVIQLK